MHTEKGDRYQVRIQGRHDDTTNIPDRALPWAARIKDGAAHGRIGSSARPFVKGTRVLGIWYDKDYQIPIILGSLDKAGDLIGNMSQDGIPAINTQVGSIPALAYGTKYSNYTALNPNRPSIIAINAGLASVESVLATSGVIFADAVQKLFKIPLYPTTASASKTLTLDVLKLIQRVDPSYLNSSLHCMVPNFSRISFSIGNLAGMLASALVRALLAVAAKLGLFKVLNMLNQALAMAQGYLAAAQQIMSMINTLANMSCLPNPINQNPLASINLAIAQAMYALNSAVGWVAGAMNNPITAAASAAVTSLLSDHAASAPRPASVATDTTPVPSPVVDEPPDNFVQVYYEDSDPYPGYITWEDPDNLLPDVYTLRNGEPLYSSAEEHAHHVTQQHMASGLESSMTSGNFSMDSMISQVTSSFDVGSAFAVTRVLGAGFGKIGSIAALAFAVPTLAKVITSIFQPQQLKTKLKNENTQKPVDDFAQDQNELEQKMKKMRSAVQGSASSSPLPTPPIPPDAGGATPSTTETPTTAPDINSMIATPESPPQITSENLINPAGVPSPDVPPPPQLTNNAPPTTDSNLRADTLDSMQGPLPQDLTNRFMKKGSN